jgi:hypothetical protein
MPNHFVPGAPVRAEQAPHAPHRRAALHPGQLGPRDLRLVSRLQLHRVPGQHGGAAPTAPRRPQPQLRAPPERHPDHVRHDQQHQRGQGILVLFDLFVYLIVYFCSFHAVTLIFIIKHPIFS